MRIKVCVSVFCMLVLSVSLVGQTFTERHRNGVIAEQYTLNKNGDMVGSWKKYDNRGICYMAYNYNVKGEKSGKQYEYAYANKPSQYERYSLTGGILLEQVRYDYDLSVTPKKQIILSRELYDKNGKQTDKWLYAYGSLIKMYTRHAEYESFRLNEDLSKYSEKYNSNDTVYVWHDPEYKNAKQYFVGKKLKGQFIEKYDSNGKLEFNIHDLIYYDGRYLRIDDLLKHNPGMSVEDIRVFYEELNNSSDIE